VLPGADYKLLEFDAEHRPVLHDVARVVRHPQFDLKALLGHRATADVALLKLPTPLDLVPAAVAPADTRVAVGDRFLVAGYGWRRAATAAAAERCAPRSWPQRASPGPCNCG
jgi:hypothetical protein